MIFGTKNALGFATATAVFVGLAGFSASASEGQMSLLPSEAPAKATYPELEKDLAPAFNGGSLLSEDADWMGLLRLPVTDGDAAIEAVNAGGADEGDIFVPSYGLQEDVLAPITGATE